MVTFQKNVPIPEPLSSWVALSQVGGREASPRQEGIFISLALNPVLIQLLKSDLSATRRYGKISCSSLKI